MEADRRLLRGARERLDGWTYTARDRAYRELFAGDDAAVTAEERPASRRGGRGTRGRRRATGYWGTDEYAVVMGHPKNHPISVVCTRHPDDSGVVVPGRREPDRAGARAVQRPPVGLLRARPPVRPRRGQRVRRRRGRPRGVVRGRCASSTRRTTGLATAAASAPTWPSPAATTCGTAVGTVRTRFSNTAASSSPANWESLAHGRREPRPPVDGTVLPLRSPRFRRRENESRIQARGDPTCRP